MLKILHGSSLLSRKNAKHDMMPLTIWCGKKKSPQIINARHGVGKREPSYTVGGNVNFGAAHHGK